MLDGDGEFKPLGSGKRVWEDDDKDDEERRPESALFGTPYVPVRTGDECDEEEAILGTWPETNSPTS